ncbi:MAG TPA: DUF5615 family PIN-like protein [Pirellulaceae bacterium]|jgi:hypothetical protein|nr:DUF5615 family PIN-like protein [Pirellulaceae bacterium]
MIRLYLDEDSMSHSLVSALRGQGVEVLTAFEAGLIQASDEEQIAFATSKGAAIYSFNVSDFYRIHAERLRGGKSHTGIILCQQQQYSIGEQLRRLMKLLGALTELEMVDRVEFLSAWD